MDPYTRICFNDPRYNDEKVPTLTSDEQATTEDDVLEVYNAWLRKHGDVDANVQLAKHQHITWIMKALKSLPSAYAALYATQPWFVYWCVHSLDLMGVLNTMPDTLSTHLIEVLFNLQHPKGGFCGSPGVLPHVLSTYPAILALLTLGARCNKLEDVMKRINIPGLRDFYVSCFVSEGLQKGSFNVQPDGEGDTRVLYGVLSICALLQIDIKEYTHPHSIEWLRKCQNYDGGIGGVPYDESHGGYAFCGLACSILLNSPKVFDLDRLLHWMTQRQLSMEGGFSGRANKLVDACYSFWVGAMFPLWNVCRSMAVTLHTQAYHAKCIIEEDDEEDTTTTTDKNNNKVRDEFAIFRNINTNTPLHDDICVQISSCVLPNVAHGWLFNQRALSLYTLIAAQDINPNNKPGLRDKPPKYADFYHTCYGLSGLAHAQYSNAPVCTREEVLDFGIFDEDDDAAQQQSKDEIQTVFNYNDYKEISPHFLGGKSNALLKNNALFNVTEGVLSKITAHLTGNTNTNTNADESNNNM